MRTCREAVQDQTELASESVCTVSETVLEGCRERVKVPRVTDWTQPPSSGRVFGSLLLSLTLFPRPHKFGVSGHSHWLAVLPGASLGAGGGSLLCRSVHFLPELICSYPLFPIFLQDAQMFVSSLDLLLDLVP